MDDVIALVPDAVWDERGRRAGYAVLVLGETIVDILPEPSVPAKVVRRRFEGCTLLPGLIDCHAHLSEWMMPGFLAAGVTTVRDTGNDLDFIIDLKADSEADTTSGPSVAICGPLIDGPEAHWPRIGRSHQAPEDVRASIDSLHQRGVDAIKLYVNIDHDLMGAAMESATQVGLPVLAHLGVVDAVDAVGLGVREIQHLSGCVHHVTGADDSVSDPADVEHLIDLFRSSGVVNCPTVVVWDRIARVNENAFRHDERLAWVHPIVRQAWDGFAHRNDPPESRLSRQASVAAMKGLIGALAAAGCVITAGSDAPWPFLAPGFSLHDELAQLVDAGLTNHQALVAATSAAADVLRRGNRIGRLSQGLDADLLVVEGDPTVEIADIGRVHTVMRRGVTIEMDHLRDRRDRAFADNALDPMLHFMIDVDTRRA